MSVDPNQGRPAKGGPDKRPGDRQAERQPEWANGLRRLYESVVEEPLPDSFTSLLSQLDKQT